MNLKPKWLSNMFNTCKSLVSIGDTSTWDVSQVKRIDGLFQECWKLEELKLENWDISNVTSISEMFLNCKVLKADIRNWNLKGKNIALAFKFTNPNKFLKPK